MIPETIHDWDYSRCYRPLNADGEPNVCGHGLLIHMEWPLDKPC